MSTVYIDPAFDARTMTDIVYDGGVVVRSNRPAMHAFVEHARRSIEGAFTGLDPRSAQYSLAVEEFVDRFAPLKRSFIHDPASRDAMRGVLDELGFDPMDTYIDVPRLRVSTSDGYLTSGVAYAHHPHRDTWYSAPMSQLNWWFPVYAHKPTAGMEFHPRYWSQGVRNGSSAFDYYRWNADGRANAKAHIHSDTRVQPHAHEELELDPSVRIVMEPGTVMTFSAAQLHSTCRNDTGVSRWSVDFRTVSIRDVAARGGAPNVDSEPTGTSLRDFIRMSDGAPMPEELARMYDDRSDVNGTLVFAGSEG